MRTARHAALAALLYAPGAKAQTADVPPLLPAEPPPITQRYTAVFERQQPGYEVKGIPLGDFTLLPSLKTAAAYDDNILALPSDRIGDLFVRFQPELALQSDRGSNAFTLDARGTLDRYAGHAGQDISDYLVTASDRYDVSNHTILRVAARAESDHESPLSEDEFVLTIHPLAYYVQTGALDVIQNAGRFQIEATGEIARARFGNGIATDGTPYIQTTSDNLDRFVQLKLTYRLTSSFGVFAQGLYDMRSFGIATADTPLRNSHGYQALAGIVFEPAALMRGTIGIGYISEDFSNPFYRNIVGPDFAAKLSFFPTQLTTVTVQGNRSVQDSGIPSVGGYLSTTASLEVDHELLRSLILSASVEYQHNTYGNIDRRDTRITVTPAVRYRLNRWLELDANYQRLDQQSHGTDAYRPYVDNRLTIGLTLRR